MTLHLLEKLELDYPLTLCHIAEVRNPQILSYMAEITSKPATPNNQVKEFLLMHRTAGHSEKKIKYFDIPYGKNAELLHQGCQKSDHQCSEPRALSL
jgi:hypothetical protein